MGDPRESLEVPVRSLLDFFVSHVPIMAHFSLLQEVYCCRNLCDEDGALK